MMPHEIGDVTPDMSFLEMLDLLNEELIKRDELPIEFESDCREGICGTCGLVIDGVAHGPRRATATCEVYMRNFKDGDTIVIEPFHARAFPRIKDLVINRSAFDRIIMKGGYISINTGSAPEANNILIPKDTVERSMDSAACIGCGACVAACPNTSAALFTSAKITHLALLPQGHPERSRRVQGMIRQMDIEGFGDCSNHGECEAVCPKAISIGNIAKMRREFIRAIVK